MRRKRKRILRRLVLWTGVTVIGIVLSLALFTAIASGFGWRFEVVTGKSMEPTYKPGGLVVTRPVSAADVRIGDAVLFKEPVTGAFVCHRAIEIKQIDKEFFFQTKGEGNEYPDPDLVSAENLAGKAVLYIPQVGEIARLSRLHETLIVFMGMKLSLAMLLVVVMGLIIVGMEVRNIWEWTFRKERKRHQEWLRKRKRGWAR